MMEKPIVKNEVPLQLAKPSLKASEMDWAMEESDSDDDDY